MNGTQGRWVLADIYGSYIRDPIDYMHYLLEGIMKWLIKKWLIHPTTALKFRPRFYELQILANYLSYCIIILL